MNGRSFEFELTEEYKKIFNPLIELLNNNRDKYFVSFRTQPDRMTIYYKKREMFELRYRNEQWYIMPRNISSSETKKHIVNANKKFLSSLDEFGFKYEEVLVDEQFDLVKFFEINKTWIDDYCEDKETEEIIQNRIACAYSCIRDNLLCIDMEYILSKNMKNGSEIAGRYDFMFLKKNIDNKYEIVLGELKSTKKACRDLTTGIMNHFEDMAFFKDEFNNNIEFKKRIIDDIIFSLEMKREFGLLDVDIKNVDIKDKISEFRMIFKMIEDEKKNEPHVLPEYHKLIALELEDKKKAGKRTSLGIRLDDILEKIDTQKVYYLTEDLKFREI